MFEKDTPIQEKIELVKNAPTPRVVINACMHGSEQIGLRVQELLADLDIQKGSLFFHVANRAALAEDKRFLDVDLNRNFPGDLDGNREEKLAAELTPLFQAADVVIDIHSTNSGLEDAIIVENLNQITRDAISAISPRNVLFMDFPKSDRGPGLSVVGRDAVGIAFEYGSDLQQSAIEGTAQGCKALLAHLGMIEGEYSLDNESKWYQVNRKIPRPKGSHCNPDIKNYIPVKEGDVIAFTTDESGVEEPVLADQDFIPIIFGETTYIDYFGFGANEMF